MALNFSNTEIAFKNKSDNSLRKATWLFKSFNYPFIVEKGPMLAVWALKWHLPFVRGIVRNTIFGQFCGGETVNESMKVVAELNSANIKSILDYSVEGEENEENFDATRDEILRTIEAAKSNPSIAFSVFKSTGIARVALLEKANEHYLKALNENKFLDLNDLENIFKPAEFIEFKKAYQRFTALCDAAAAANINLFVDAEETWIQHTLDAWTESMMLKHNKTSAIIYTTIQMYRHDRIAYTKRLVEIAKANGFFIGIKIVRGAYMEKERERAIEMNYPSPIHIDKESCDKDFNDVIHYCVHTDIISICAGTHNEESSLKLTQWMAEKNIEPSNKRFFFAQLLGMSDNLSFNLAASGYEVAKYVPYGPVLSVLPYLSRRAQENSSVKGQVGRELGLIKQEQQRRRKN
ncbi:MAG: proline dehydrogenase family protein [Bacteroidetes bacterium]|nr:proline dehydrogenase family protein [Bacteroidota bacterium]